MNRVTRRQMFERLREQNPEPTTELNWTNEFELLAAVLMSAQSTDVGVNKVTAKLFAVANHPRAVLDLGLAPLKQYMRSLGLYNSKAEHLWQTCHLLLDRHQGQVPATREALEALPGVGRKTANVILNTAFGQPTMAVDTHIFRVANRTGLAPGSNVLQVELALLKYIPKEFLIDAHHWLILHGRYVCKARSPQCSSCLIADLCDHYRPTRRKLDSSINNPSRQ